MKVITFKIKRNPSWDVFLCPIQNLRMHKKHIGWVLFFLHILVFTVDAQRDTSILLKRRIIHQGILQSGVYASGIITLNEAWYKGYPRSPMHSFDDHKEWLQVDKVGHGWTAYQLTRAAASSWQATGMDARKAAWLGGGSGWMFMTVIELLDARSSQWGWSWSDMAANTVGATLFTAQQLHWKDQKFQWKFSFHPTPYAQADLQARASDLFGRSLAEQALKNYNHQTYWLSMQVGHPKWLNISVGYGADGLWGGFENKKKALDGTVVFDRTDVARVREFYLAPDIDLTKIPTRKLWVKKLLWCFNAIKIPAPTLMYNSKGRWKFYPLYF